MDPIQTVVSFFTGLLPAQYSIGLLVVGVSTVLLTMYGLRTGPGRLVAVLFSMYAGVLVYIHFPYTTFFTSFGNTPVTVACAQLGLYLFFVLVIHWIALRAIPDDLYTRLPYRFLETALLVLLCEILLLVFIYQLAPIAVLHDVTAPWNSYFESSAYFFWWLISPLVGLLLLLRR